LTVLLSSSALASAGTLPSDLMRPEPAQAVRGYVANWLFSIELESTDLRGLEPCRKLLAERGFAPTLSKTASSAIPDLHFKVAGVKEYQQIDVEAADTVLATVQQAKCPGTLTWTVTSKQIASPVAVPAQQ
jgi:hypothetical protein